MAKVLIVDDEKSIRLTLQKFLLNEGLEADVAQNATEAIEKFDNNPYDVLITDIIMPKISGVELVDMIREKSKAVQIIIMTGEPTVETAVKAVQSGANDYIPKPIDKNTLLKAVKSAIRIKEIYDQKEELEKDKENYQKNLENIVAARTNQLQDAMESIITLLSGVVEARDPYTAGHQIRVGNLSAMIAQKMELPKDTVEFIRIIGYIHDIGKINIPTEILSKPGKLNNLEMQLIREHPKNGYDMIKGVNLPEIISKTILQHHERCDGSGYPNFTKNNSLSIESQIIMVADVVEAMMSHRPYRPALGIEAALDEIKEQKNIKYNSAIVDACVELLEKENYQFEDCAQKINFPL